MDLLSSTVFQTSLQHLRAGLSADCQLKHKDAAFAYMEGMPPLMQLAREEGASLPVRQLLKSKIKLYLNRVQLIKAKLDAKEDVPPIFAVDKARPNVEGHEFVQSLSYLPCECSLEDVKGMKQVKDFLWKNVVLPLLFPGFPDSVTRVKKGILFYGLPGTGKTMLMSAVASTVSCPVFRFSTVDLISRFEGNELCVARVKDAFKYARQNQPCVVCVDDLEMLCPRDGDTEGSITAKVRDELISQLMDLSGENQVTVIAATQQPWLLSGTMRRRFDRRFYLSLPSTNERVQILSQSFADMKHQLSETDFDLFGQMTPGFTGSDLKVVARSCGMAYLRALQKATHFRKVTVSPEDGDDKSGQEMLVPCDPHEPGAIEITFDFLNPERLLELPVTRTTVEDELKNTRPSVCDVEVQQMNQWHEEFGQED